MAAATFELMADGIDWCLSVFVDNAGIIAFEPNPANLPLLREAAEDDVTIVERAASDVADVTVAFNLPTGTDQVCCLRPFSR